MSTSLLSPRASFVKFSDYDVQSRKENELWSFACCWCTLDVKHSEIYQAVHQHNAAALLWRNLFLVFSVSKVVFLYGSEKSRFLVLRWGCRLGDGQTLTADAWTGNHWQPRRQSSAWWSLPPLCWCGLVAALPRWSAKQLSTHQSPQASAGVNGIFPVWCPRRHVIVQWVQIWKVWGVVILFNEP